MKASDDESELVGNGITWSWVKKQHAIWGFKSRFGFWSRIKNNWRILKVLFIIPTCMFIV